MKRARRLLAALGAAAVLAAPAGAYAPAGYPGAIWGGVSRDASGFEGWGTQGWIRQGVTWTRLPWDMPLETYGYYRWRLRGENRAYYDAHGPALSVELTKAFAAVGLDYYWQFFPELRRQEDHSELFASWYWRRDLARGRELKPLGLPLLGLPLSTWGVLRRDLGGLEGNASQGWIQQGVDVLRLPGAVTVTPLVGYRWRFRSRNRPYYNTHGPAVGLEFSRGPFQAGMENVWRSYPELKRSERALLLYVSWYHDWDLKRR